MRLNAIDIRNFKRVVAAHIEMRGAVVTLCGANAAGKSSAIDAVWAALGGKGASPDRPIRAGAREAEVTLDLGDLRVTRKWRAREEPGPGHEAYTTSLVVENADGTRPRSPQAILDEIVGRLAFDPVAFARQSPREQADTLRALVGLDTRKLDADRDEAFRRRTDLARALKAREAVVAAMPPGIEGPETPVVSVLERQRAAFALKEANDQKRRAAQAADAAHVAQEAVVVRLEQQLKTAREKLVALDAAADAALDACRGLTDPDMEALAREAQAVEQHNALVRQRGARERARLDLDGQRGEVQALTDHIGTIDAEKARMLAAARFPLPGLGIERDVVTLNGLPLSQASSAEQLRASVAIGAALCPKLRFLAIRDGSLLDERGLAWLHEWAEKEGCQILMEVVGDRPGAVLFVEGEVARAPREKEVAA